jgi:hypothetical protein
VKPEGLTGRRWKCELLPAVWACFECWHSPIPSPSPRTQAGATGPRTSAIIHRSEGKQNSHFGGNLRKSTAFWLPGRDQIVYVTPQDLAPLPGGHRKRNVWVQQLMFFDPVKGTPTAITSGLTNNVDPSWCEGTPSPLAFHK